MLKKLFVLLMLFVPLTVNADNKVDNILEEEKFVTVFEDNIEPENNVNGSSIIAGNNVISKNAVNGINMMFGNNVNYQGVSDYAVIAGNIIELSGNINNDGFVFGNIITFKKDFTSQRDLFVFGSSVELSGNINRDIIIYASTVKIDSAVINGNIKIYATTLEINDDVKVEGTLSYNEDIEKNIKETAQINEVILLDKLEQTKTVSNVILDFIVGYIGIMLVFLVLAFAIPSLFKKIEKSNEEFKLSKIFSLFGFGALLLIGIPMIIIALFMTTIGSTLALLGLLFYIIIICLTTILSGYLLGYLIWNKFIKKENNILLIGLIGISIISILNIIPVIGEYIAVITLMIGLGLVLELFKK